MRPNLPNHWPPDDEPVVPAAVVARLDELSWPASRNTLLDYSTHHAAIRTSSRRYVLVSLVDGHRVAEYRSQTAAAAAFYTLTHRPQGDQP